MEMTFLDFFSGIGGFRHGFELCGMRCVGHCEIDRFADRSYHALYDVKGEEWFAKDITKIKSAELPRANLWSGGFPCQDISCCNSRQLGLSGKRSGLFFEITRLLEGTAPKDRPEWVVLENVKNLLSIHRGFDLAVILDSLASLGYCVEYGLLNSRFFSVPQNRERVFLVAYRHSGAGSERKIFPLPAIDGKALIQLISGMQGQRVYNPDGISVTLAAQGGGWGGKTGLYAVNCENQQKASFVDLSKRKPKLTSVARCIKAKYNSGVTNRSADSSGVFYGQARDMAGKLFAAKGRIRRLTPRECWRLQGFSDAMFEKAQAVNSDSQLYRQAGNSVTVTVVYAVGQRILKVQEEFEGKKTRCVT